MKFIKTAIVATALVSSAAVFAADATTTVAKPSANPTAAGQCIASHILYVQAYGQLTGFGPSVIASANEVKKLGDANQNSEEVKKSAQATAETLGKSFKEGNAAAFTKQLVQTSVDSCGKIGEVAIVTPKRSDVEQAIKLRSQAETKAVAEVYGNKTSI